ncbi:6-phosphofructokinase [candidate division WOR-3 bacterium 4484_100]|uniref:ATP-dependent 6-phosphofructokinase n=1 Tax=candidate division WOR-3 bacterium 4484_100 TaxID=1936077 RepID=A0A1V4QGV9_UNCW3|nr:MAG: 6-phosphofructokinase [candidate division WOR-3 bacterium 4484_100]
MKRIGILTSGGDAPGMNAAIRAVVRTALHYRLKVFGIRYGYQGLVDGDLIELDRGTVANIIQRGGTILGTARSQAFETRKGMARAKKIVDCFGLDALVVIGGDGTMRGAQAFMKRYGVKIIGLPGTIDNDLYGTDFTIGFDTAVNNALDAVDQIRDTASSLERLFFIEVMGRKAGFIGLAVALAGGAEEVLIPETKTSIPELIKKLNENIKKGKKSNIVIVSEGDEAGNAFTIARKVRQVLNEDYRVAVLGYIQRGGKPSANDRILASKLGNAAVEAIRKGIFGCMVGEVDRKIVYTPFKQTYTKRKKINKGIYRIIRILSE